MKKQEFIFRHDIINDEDSFRCGGKLKAVSKNAALRQVKNKIMKKHIKDAKAIIKTIFITTEKEESEQLKKSIEQTILAIKSVKK